MSNTITLTASQLHTIMTLHDVPPSKDFIAAAGRDYGHVLAWELEDGYLIQYGNNAETNYDFADDADDLAGWLEYDIVDGLDRIIQTANVRGEDAVAAAEDDDEGPFYILATSYWYGATESSHFITNDDRSQTTREFDTYEAAQDWIDEAEGEVYILSHNESGRPSYKIVAE